MSNVFDGKKFANEKEKEVKKQVELLKKKKVTPKITSILIGNDPASKIYLNLKKNASQRLGIKMTVKQFSSVTDPHKIIDFIQDLNKDDSVQGVMVQLPMPRSFDKKKKEILNSIKKSKDVDGLREVSSFTPATAKAVSQVTSFAIKPLAYIGKKAAVVGSKGTVGKAVTVELQKLGFRVVECDITTRDLYAKIHEVDLVVSATGVSSLIKSEMLKEGVIVIDCGAPSAEFEFKSVSQKASFITPVPGGIGPVTIISLFENLVEACLRE